MSTQDPLPMSHSSQYSAHSACSHCDGVIRHEPWCVTLNASVEYAYQAISDPDRLSPGDHLILHALGASWAAKISYAGCASNETAGQHF
jgi:hypothetical protein